MNNSGPSLQQLSTNSFQHAKVTTQNWQPNSLELSHKIPYGSPRFRAITAQCSPEFPVVTAQGSLQFPVGTAEGLLPFPCRYR